MAKPRTFVISSYALCLLLLLLSNQEAAKPAEALRKCYSEKYRGPCIYSTNCNNICKDKERARKGECHPDGFGRACFCYYKSIS